MGSVNIGPQMDDAELEDELDQLQQQELEDKMLETGAVPVLPTVANGESESTVAQLGSNRTPHTDLVLVKNKPQAVAAVEDDEEAELRKLQAEMAM